MARDDFVALVASADRCIVGALVPYEPCKFEKGRSEFYIYDLAVAEHWRRRGVATAMIEDLKVIARKNGGWAIFVQADYEDESAIALCEKLGTCGEAIHFDLSMD